MKICTLRRSRDGLLFLRRGSAAVPAVFWRSTPQHQGLESKKSGLPDDPSLPFPSRLELSPNSFHTGYIVENIRKAGQRRNEVFFQNTVSRLMCEAF
jgi:hypothetical protein